MGAWGQAVRTVFLSSAWAVVLAFVLLVALGTAHAQPVAAPPGSGWQWQAATPSPYGGFWVERAAPPAEWVLAYQVVEYGEMCSDPLSVYSVSYSADPLEYGIRMDCVVSWDPFLMEEGTGSGGIWWRYVAVSAPEDPASAPAGDLSKVESHLELLAYAGFVVAAGLGYSGGRVR